MRRPLVLAVIAGVLVSTSAAGAGREAARASTFDCGITVPSLADVHSALPQLKRLHATFLVVSVQWAAIAPTQPTEARDPNDPAYRWQPLDSAARAAAAYGVQLILDPYSTPGWANGNRPPSVSPTDASDYADFLVALANRYPHVHRWLIWGEPNRLPQWQPQGRAGAQRYAQLLDLAYGAIKSVRPTDLVIGGNTEPTGNNKGFDTSPRNWLAWMTLPNGRRPRLDLYGHTAFTQRPIDMSLSPASAYTYDFDDMDTLAAQLDRYYPGRHIQLFLSETGTPTDHPNHDWLYFTTRADQAHRMLQMFQQARSFGRIAAMSNYLLRDEPDGGWSTGLIAVNGVRKPAYSVFASQCKR